MKLQPHRRRTAPPPEPAPAVAPASPWPAARASAPSSPSSPSPPGQARQAPTFWDRATIVALECPPHRASIDVWHATEPGFGVRIGRPKQRTGLVSRSYIARLKDAEGRELRPVLGPFESTAYEEARYRALTLRAEAAARRRSGRPAVPTLAAALTAYASRPSLAPASRDDYAKRARYLTGWPASPEKWAAARPAERLASWADRRLDSITPSEWLERYERIERLSGSETAKGVARLARAVHKDLLATRTLDADPTEVLARFEIYARSTRPRRFIERKDLPAVWQWLHTHAHPAARDYVLTGLMTGLRESVLGALRWEQVDIERKLLLVPRDARGNKRREDVWMPLAEQLFRRVFLPRYAAPGRGAWVLPSPKRPGKPLHDVRGTFEAMGAATGVRIADHDLRRTFGALSRVVTRDPLLSARMLTHSQSSMTEGGPVHTGGYLPVELDDMRDAFNAVANALVWYSTHAPAERPPANLPSEWLELDCGWPAM